MSNKSTKLSPADFAKNLMKSVEGEAVAQQDAFVPGEDEVNPIYLFSGTHTELLLRCANHEFNLLQMARKELVNRGLNRKGEWIGWRKK